MLEVQFKNSAGNALRTVQVESGTNLRQAAVDGGVKIYQHIFRFFNCRGKGLCGTCTVEIESGDVAPLNEIETKKLGSKLKEHPKLRLACQLEINDNLVVTTRNA